MRSPIKSIIRNKTNTYYRNRLASNIAMNLAPMGEAGDSVEFLGDVFTMIDRASASDLLMGSILSGNVELSYVIDNVVSFSANTDKPNFRGGAEARELIGKANGYCETEVVAPVVAEVKKEEPKQEKPAQVVDPVVEEPVKVEEPAEEPVKEEAPQEEPKQEPAKVAEDKPKRQRKIKVD